MTAQENCASTNETVYEPSRKTPVKAHADVVVAGGGVAGVAAALAARRAGASVVLLEKECGLGGLATLGNVIIFLPLCDGRGRQVIGGLGEELLRLSVARVRNPLPRCVSAAYPTAGLATRRPRKEPAIAFGSGSTPRISSWIWKACSSKRTSP